MHCRFCKASPKHLVVSLGFSPLANSYLGKNQLTMMEPHYPLEAYLCQECFLMQIPEFESPQAIFGNYAYFSSFSDSWLKHSEAYAKEMAAKLKLNSSSQVVELASNDGYLLQYFKAQGIPVLGIEPAANVAKVAQDKGIPTEVAFFNEALAVEMVDRGNSADLLIANNVLAHTPSLNSFVKGFRTVLKPQGVFTVEVPHLLNLLKDSQFDTIYHEHFSYFSFYTLERIFSEHGLKVFDVAELTTHGGSLRIYGCRNDCSSYALSERVLKMRAKEEAFGICKIEPYQAFGRRVVEIKREVLKFLIESNEAGKKVVGYGAPAKGNTLLNYCGIRSDMILYTVDRNPHKQNHFLPGSGIPIFPPEQILKTKPDYIMILPWNLSDEVASQLSVIRDWGGKFVTAIPKIRIF